MISGLKVIKEGNNSNCVTLNFA